MAFKGQETSCTQLRKTMADARKLQSSLNMVRSHSITAKAKETMKPLIRSPEDDIGVMFESDEYPAYT